MIKIVFVFLDNAVPTIGDAPDIINVTLNEQITFSVSASDADAGSYLRSTITSSDLMLTFLFFHQLYLIGRRYRHTCCYRSFHCWNVFFCVYSWQPCNRRPHLDTRLCSKRTVHLLDVIISVQLILFVAKVSFLHTIFFSF